MTGKTKYYFCYDLNIGNNGYRRWKYFIFYYEGDKPIPQHDHKIEAYQNLENSGEVPWTTNVLQQLRHLFRHKHDTFFFC